MKIILKLETSENFCIKKFSISDLGYTEDEWNKLTEDEKLVVLEKKVNEIKQPYWVIDSIRTEE